MDDIKHSVNSYTIYTKSGCHNCTKVKNLLKNEKNKLLLIDCDDYLIENKTEFLEFMKNKIGKEWKTFPMVFDNNIFIGGFDEIKKYKEKLDAFTFDNEAEI